MCLWSELIFYWCGERKNVIGLYLHDEKPDM